jgi:DNA-binding transcriptional ArsR family regulator
MARLNIPSIDRTRQGELPLLDFMDLTSWLTPVSGSIRLNSMVESNDYNLDLIFQALSDPTRRAILEDLSLRERGITEIAKPFRMSLAAVSKHVRVLEKAKLIHRRRDGSFSYLSVNGEAMLTADEWIGCYKKFWTGRLASLKRLMERERK